MSTDPVSDLRRLFTWREGDHHAACCAALERNHLTAVAQVIHARLDGNLRAALEQLPDDAYLAIVRGPDTFFAALHGPAGELAGSVSRWIAVERALAAGPGAPAGPDGLDGLDGILRTAGFDRHVEIAGGRVVAIHPAPRVPGTRITLDFASELPSRLLARSPDRVLAVPTAEERALTITKLAQAVALLDTASPFAADFVRRLTDVICCRTAPGDGRFSTASDPSTLGVTHLINTHLARTSASEVASELVHEAIHQAVFRHELVSPLLADQAIALEKVMSPWTGAMLDLHAFLRACFAWYGVANLWRLPPAAVLPPPGRRREAAEGGFARRPLGQLGRLAERLPPGLQAMITQMTEEVCRRAHEVAA